MGVCEDKIKADIMPDCDNLVTQGYEQNGWLINFADFVGTTDDPSNPNKATAIELMPAAKAYRVTVIGNKPWEGSNTKMVQNNVKNKYSKTLKFTLAWDGPDCAQVIRSLADGKFIFIVETTWGGKNGDSKFEIVGSETGCMVSEQDRNRTDEALNGGWGVTMVENNAIKPGFYFDAGGIVATRAALAQLVAGAA